MIRWAMVSGSGQFRHLFLGGNRILWSRSCVGSMSCITLNHSDLYLSGTGALVQIPPHRFSMYVRSLAYDTYVLISCFPPHHGVNCGVQSSLVGALGCSRIMRGLICILYVDPPEVVKSRRDSPLCVGLGRWSVMHHLFNQAAMNVSGFWLCCHVRCRRSTRHLAFR